MAENETNADASSAQKNKGIRRSYKTQTIMIHDEMHTEASYAQNRGIRRSHRIQPFKTREETHTDASSIDSVPDKLKPFYPTGKTSWPELVGLTGEEAEKKIKEEKAGVHTVVLPIGSNITLDDRSYRVRIFVNSSGNVAKPPTIG